MDRLLLAGVLLWGAVVGVTALMGHRRLSYTLGLIIGGMALAGAWLAFVTDLRQQNHPMLARLVPGHVGVLRAALLGVAGLLGALGATAGLLLGLPPALSWLVVAGVLTALACMAAYPVLWFGVWLLPWAGSVLWRQAFLAPLWAALGQRPWGTAALGTALLAATLWHLLGSGDTSHRSRHASDRLWRNTARMSGHGRVGGAAHDLPRPMAWLAWLQHAPYLAWLRHRCTPAASPLERLALGMGPALHWTGLVGNLAGLAAVASVVAAGLAIWWWGDTGRLARVWLDQGALVGMCIAISSTTVSVAVAVAGTLWHTRREQGLLMLLPGVPRGAALNRGLGLRVGLLALGAWGLGAALMLALTHGSAVAPGAQLLAVATLCDLGLVWGDFARLRKPGGWRQALPVLGPLALAGIAWALHRHAGLPLPAAMAALAAVAAGMVAWRWRVQQAAPAVLPAARAG